MECYAGELFQSAILKFDRDGHGLATYGYGQTIYAKVRFAFEVSAGSVLRLKYLPSPATRASQAFEPGPDNAQKLIRYNLTRGEYQGIESVVGWPFICEWLFSLDDSPWPAGMTFPYSVPKDFYGYRRNKPRQPKQSV